MPIAFNPNGNFNQAVDLSEALNIIPNRWGLFNALSLFETDPKALKIASVPIYEFRDGIAIDRNWDERNSVTKPPLRRMLTLAIPHFPLDDAITPNDVDGVIDWQNVLQNPELETVASVRAMKMEILRQYHAQTLEAARAQLITEGTVYAPSGTMVQSYGATINYYTEFGVTRTEIQTDLANPLIDPTTLWSQAIAGVQDGLQNGEAINNFIAVCSDSYFDALITNAFYAEAYKFASWQNNPMLTALNTQNPNGLDARYRSFTTGGITFIAYRGTRPDGTPYIPDGDAYLFPTGVRNLFKTYYAPANRFSTINRRAQEAYYFEYLNGKDDIIEIMSESNFLNAVLRPQAIVRLYLAP